MRKSFIKTAALTTMLTVCLSATAFAGDMVLAENTTGIIEENNEKSGLLIDNDAVSEMLQNDLKENPHYVENPVFTESIGAKLKKSAEYQVNAGEGDIYEPNNGPAAATQGKSGSKVNATIHADTDVDWYGFQVTQADVNDGVIYSFILTNIPIGCDYDMYLLDETFAGYADLQSGNTTEQFYLTFNTAGTYYVAVQSDLGYSDSAYTLYFGRTYKSGYRSYTDTGLTYNFGNIPLGNTTEMFTGWLSYNLTNATDIPDSAIVERFYLTDHGNGAYWIGLSKWLAAQNGDIYKQYGGILLMDMNYGNNYYVKQNWSIRGSIIHSNYFVWTPKVAIEYQYPVIPQNLRFIN